jgi:two-component system response regulator MprA
MSRLCSSRPRVLLIENAGERRDALRTFLEGNGYPVESAGDGAAGLRRAIVWRPDAAVVGTDVRPAGGYAEARCLRDAFGRSIVLIARARSGHPFDRQRAEAVGFDHLLSADDDPAELHELLLAVKPQATPPELA